MGQRGIGAKPIRRDDTGKKPRKTRLAWEKPGLTRAQRVVAFIEGLVITSGKFAGQKFRLRDWQRAIIERLYAERRGRRIVRQALVTTPRKQGKTQLSAALALCHLAGPESEQRGQIYSAAADRDQASLLFREMAALVDANADLSARCNILRFKKQIEVLKGAGVGSVYTALSSDARKAHGLNPSCAIYDELAQAPDRHLYDNLLSGMGARENPLMIVISTQSPDPEHVMSQLVQHGERVIAGEIEDPAFLPIIYSAPPDADPWDEAVWHRCNPALGDFRSIVEMRDFAERARKMPSLEPTFRGLYLNQPVAVDDRLFSVVDWLACQADFDPEELSGAVAFGGLDLAATIDLNSYQLFFPGDGDRLATLLSWFWLPADGLVDRGDRDHVDYVLWRNQGWLEVTPGKTVDKRYVARRISEINADYDVREIGADPWHLKEFQALMSYDGIALPLVDFIQGKKSFAPAVAAMEVLLTERRLRHPGSPMMAWNVRNCKGDVDHAGNRMPTKSRSIGRIDGIVAAILAVGRAQLQAAPSNDGPRLCWIMPTRSKPWEM